MSPDKTPDLTVREFAEAANVSDKTVRRAISRGEINARRRGPRLIRIPASELATWGRPLQYTGGAA